MIVKDPKGTSTLGTTHHLLPRCLKSKIFKSHFKGHGEDGNIFNCSKELFLLAYF